MRLPSGQHPARTCTNEEVMDQSSADAASPDFHVSILECIPHLRAFARSLTRDREHADDLVQDVIVRALSAADQFTPGTNFKAWVFTILRNHFYNEVRKRRTQPCSIHDPSIPEPSIPATQEASLEYRDFCRAFWKLNDEHREVLILVGANGVSYDEAACICGCAVGTIKSRLSRARTELIGKLSPERVAAASPQASGAAWGGITRSAKSSAVNNRT